LADELVQRRLAAILAADIVGFSSLMERDEEGTYARVGRLRRELIEPRLSEHQGRLIKTTGDGFLAEFASPIAALGARSPSRAIWAKIRVHCGCGSVSTSATLLWKRAATSMAKASMWPHGWKLFAVPGAS
jgi:class 3 adenylate cyclase